MLDFCRSLSSRRIPNTTLIHIPITVCLCFRFASCKLTSRCFALLFPLAVKRNDVVINDMLDFCRSASFVADTYHRR